MRRLPPTALRRWALIAFVLFIALAAPVRAQTAALDPERMGWVLPDVFDAGSGLDQTIATAIAVTPERRVWVGTMRGLYRLSGGRMVEVPGPGNVFRQEIRSIGIAPDGSVWLATPSRGVFHLGDKGWVQDGPLHEGKPAIIMRLTTLTHGARRELWAVGQGAYVHRAGRWVSMPLPPRLREQMLRDVAIQPDSPIDQPVFWFASFGEGLQHCTAQGVCAQASLPPGPRANEVYSLLFTAEGQQSDLWVATFGGGVARLRDGAWTRWHTGNSALPSDYATRLLSVQDATRTQLMVGTRNGMVVLDAQDRWQRIDAPQALLGRRVFDLVSTVDAAGSPQVWMAVEGGALRLALRDQWRVVRHLEPTSNGVMSLAVERGADGAETLWMTMDARGVGRYRAGAWRDFTTADGLPRNEVRNLLVARSLGAESGIWVGGYVGNVSRLQGERFTEVPTPWPHDDAVTARLLLDDPSTGLWLSTTAHGLARRQNGRWDWMQPEQVANAPRHAFAGVRVGDALWFATGYGQGLARYRDGTWKRFNEGPGLSETSLFSIAHFPDANGHAILWIGTESGLFRVDVTDPDHPRVLPVGELAALPRIQTYDIVRDRRGDILMCTQYGITRLHWPRGGDVQITEFHQQDGLPHDECNAKAFTTDGQGRVWAGSVAGAAVYDPSVLDTRRMRPTALMVDDARVDGDAVTLRANTPLLMQPLQSLHIAFDMPTGSHERRVRYRTQLIGLEAEPSPWSTQNTRTWLGLPAGDYTLRIEAVDGNGVAAVPLEYSLHVPAPFWRRWPMLLLYGLLVLGCFTLITKWRVRSLRASNQRLEDTIRERTAALHERGEELKRINEELVHISYRDALTGLHNRRYLMEHLESVWKTHLDSGRPVAVILFDIDHFKHINDRYGHAAGDACLQNMGRCVMDSLRSDEGVAGRYGGEEFLIVLPGLGEDQAVAVAERLRTQIGQCPDHAITASFGVAATVPTDETSVDMLLLNADDALYASKSGGRNRVTAAGLMG